MNRLRNRRFAARFAHSQRGFHGADMVRRGAAASANQLHARGHEFSRVARHVFRRAEIDIPSFDRARHAGIRLCGQGQGSHRPHALDRVQHRDRSHAAVDAEHIDIPFRQAGGKGLGVGAIEAVAVFVDRDLGDDGNLRIHVAAGEHGLMQLFDVAEGFEHQQIDAALDQGGDLFAKRGAGLFKRSLAQRFDADAQRANRCGHPDIETLGRFPSHMSARQIDVAHTIRQAVPRQAKAVAAESIGLDNLGAGLEIIMMNAAD